MDRVIEPDSLQLEFATIFPEVVLASSSPNRRALLERGGCRVRVFSPDIDERRSGMSTDDTLLSIAAAKISAYIRSEGFDPTLPAIAADTMILVKGRLIGKCKERDEAREVLKMARGDKQTVITAAALYLPERHLARVFLDKSDVYFYNLTDQEIEDYLDTDEWIGAAGGYRFQRSGNLLIDRIDGDWTSVVGLPLKRLIYEKSSS